MSQQSTTNPEIVRINISLSRKLREDLQQLADDYYSGNVSRLIRAAVRDHQKTSLDDDQQLTLELLQSEVSSAVDQLDELVEHQEMSESEDPNRSAEVSDEIYDVARVIQKHLIDESEPVRESELIRQMDLSLVEIQEGVGWLLDNGSIKQIESGEEPYYAVASLSGGDVDE